MNPIHSLLAGVIRQAVFDSKLDINDKNRLTQLAERIERKRSGLEFLDEKTGQLENFLEFWHLKLDPDVIRRMAKEN